MAKKIEYPAWAKVAWRWVRVFVAGFIASFTVDAFFVGDKDIRLQILQAAITGGIAAVFKALRDGKEYDSPIHKLPL